MTVLPCRWSCWNQGTALSTFFVSFNVPLTSTVASVFKFTIFAIERNNAMPGPLKMLQLMRETVRYAIIGIWISSVALNIPLFFHTDYCFKTAACLHTYSDKAELTHIPIYIIFVFLSFPFLFFPFHISFCCSKIVTVFYLRTALAPESSIPKQILQMSLS